MDRVLSVPFLAPRASDPPLSARATDHAGTVSSYHQPNRAIRVAIGGALDTIERPGSPDGGTPYDAEIAATIVGRGGRFALVGSSAGQVVDAGSVIVPFPDVVAGPARAIVAAGVAELIAAELWARVPMLPAHS